MSSGSSSDGTFVGSWRAHQIVAEILSSPQAEQNQIIEVACGEDAVLRSRVMRMIASVEGAAGDIPSDFQSSDSLHGTGNLVLCRKLECSATRETWSGHLRDHPSSELLVHIFPTRSRFFEATVSAFESYDGPSIEQLVSHGSTPGGRAFLALNRVNGVSIHQYLTIFTTSSGQRRELFDRVHDTITRANAEGLRHESLTPDSIMISEIDGKPYPTIVGMGIQRLSFPGSLPSKDVDGVAINRIIHDLETKFGPDHHVHRPCLAPFVAGGHIGFASDRSISAALVSIVQAAMRVPGRQSVLAIALLFCIALSGSLINFKSITGATSSGGGGALSAWAPQSSEAVASSESAPTPTESTAFDDEERSKADGTVSVVSDTGSPVLRTPPSRRSSSGAGGGMLGIR